MKLRGHVHAMKSEILDMMCEKKQKADTFNFYLTYTSLRFDNILNTCYVLKQNLFYFRGHSNSHKMKQRFNQPADNCH